MTTTSRTYVSIHSFQKTFSSNKLYLSLPLSIHFNYMNLPLILLTNFLCTEINKRTAHKTKDGFAIFAKDLDMPKTIFAED